MVDEAEHECFTTLKYFGKVFGPRVTSNTKQETIFEFFQVYSNQIKMFEKCAFDLIKTKKPKRGSAQSNLSRRTSEATESVADDRSERSSIKSSEPRRSSDLSKRGSGKALPKSKPKPKPPGRGPPKPKPPQRNAASLMKQSPSQSTVNQDTSPKSTKDGSPQSKKVGAAKAALANLDLANVLSPTGRPNMYGNINFSNCSRRHETD